MIPSLLNGVDTKLLKNRSANTKSLSFEIKIKRKEISPILQQGFD